MLDSGKSRAFVENFTGQWLDLRNIDATTPDARLYPEFDELLKLSMINETESFFAELLNKNLPVSNLIHSDFAMLNSRIAAHYGIEGVTGEEFRRVSLPAGSPRGGILTQASVLKVTANGTTTSPVLRGSWVIKRLLGRPSPPPPANVGTIEPDTRGATTIREQLAKHRTSESCAGCHRNIDPPGFALESFDVIGGFRDRYRSQEKGDRVDKRSATGRSYACAARSPNLHFTDVTVANAFCKYIHYLWAKGIVEGCAAAQYCPGASLMRNAMAEFKANGFGLPLYGP